MAFTVSSLGRKIHTVALGMGDLNGIMRGKRFPRTHWDHVCRHGSACAVSFFAMDVACEVWDSPYVSFDKGGYPDFHLFPSTKPVELPWEPGVALAFARSEGVDHKPVDIDPRHVLVRQLERARSMGITVKVGAELEFFLLDPDTNMPRDVGIGVYGLDRAAQLEHVIGPIRNHINAFGIHIEQSNPEYAAGQVEVNMRYEEALQAADNVVMFRSFVKQIAAQHGYKATFMAKPFINESGNGFHAHYSLWKKEKNIFSDNGALNETGRHFIGGVQKRIAETAVCGSATQNGFRRRQPNSFCPTTASWGIDNRTVALRVIEGSKTSTRVEKRDAGADCNPYLLFGADIAAGLDGIEQKIEPSRVTTGNGYEDKDARPLPLDLGAAIALARNSKWLREVMGDDQYELYLQQCEREHDYYRRQFDAEITPVEKLRYLDNF